MHDVRLINFTQEFECEYCLETRELMKELAELPSKIKIEVYDLARDSEKVNEYNVEKISATIISADKDYAIRYFGIPSGCKFGSLL